MRWPSFKKGEKIQASFCIAESSLAIVGEKNGRIVFFDNLSLEMGDSRELLAQLKKMVSHYQLINCSCRLVLDYSQFQLLMADAPTVKEEELANALKWKVKDLLEYSIDDVLIDAFAVPPHGNAMSLKKAFVAACSQSKLLKTVSLFEDALLKLTKVTVALMAERDVLSLLEEQKGSDILLSMQDNYCYISVFLANEVYFVRKILNNEFGSLTDIREDGSNPLLLELQRSMDYCISNLKLSEPKRVILTPFFADKGGFIEHLKMNLSQTIMPLNLSELLHFESEMTLKNQMDCWYALIGIASLASKQREVTDAEH